jgi:hypothetical protein
LTGTGPGSWQPDPEGRYEYRWWDGQSWTDQVSHQGQLGRAPLGGTPAATHTAQTSSSQASGAGLSISGKNVLAFSSSLDWNIERVKGGSMATGGLFNTTLRGTGWVALATAQ